MTRRSPWLAACAALLTATACAPDESDSVAVRQDPIINGQLDTTHQAVVAVFSDMSACTGTIIHASGGQAYVLTAAHCFGDGPLKYVIRGNDYDNPDQVLQVTDFLVHPLYNKQDQTYDFALLKAKYAADNIPQIPPLAPNEDKLKPGSAIEHVGYGLTSYPNGQTTKRHHVMGTVDQVAQIQFSYNQPTSGPCSGDSGGPELVETPNGTRVAGVVSYGDAECKSTGVSGRASGVYTSFILPYVGSLPNDGMSGSSSSSSASSSSASSTSASTGGSTSSADAAVSSSASTGGAGGATGTSGAGASDAWTAGNLKPHEHTGEIVTTSCSAVPGGTGMSGTGAWWSLALLGVLFGRRRRV